MGSNDTLTYLISYLIGKHTQILIDAVPIQDTIEKDRFSYFKYIYNPLDADVVIKLTAISGNPNIVVKYKSKDEFPTFDTADLTSEEITSFETIWIS